MSSSETPACSHACCVDSVSTRTALLNVSCPSMWMKRSSWSAQMVSAIPPSVASTTGPIAPSPSGLSTTAPAPSPNRAAVRLSFGSVTRLSVSAPITSTHSARPVSTCAAPAESADSQPVQAAPMSYAAAPMPSALATTGAVFGVSSSGVIVARSTRSTSAGLRPASDSARRAALTARSAVRSSGAAKRRSRMPVRRVIQSESTPIRSAIGPLVTTRSGSLWPRPTTRAVRGGAKRPLMVFSVVASVSGMDALLRSLDLRPGHDPLRKPRQDLAGADLDEAGRAGIVDGGKGLAPEDGPDQRARELVAHVGERLRGRAREDGEPRLAQLDVVERGAERRDRRRHRGRVERAGDGQSDRALAELSRDLLGAVEAGAIAREHDLPGRVVVGDR